MNLNSKTCGVTVGKEFTTFEDVAHTTLFLLAH